MIPMEVLPTTVWAAKLPSALPGQTLVGWQYLAEYMFGAQGCPSACTDGDPKELPQIIVHDALSRLKAFSQPRLSGPLAAST